MSNEVMSKDKWVLLFKEIGLDEATMVKWHREFDTAGPWTKAGGARPEAWPQWMRSFSDY